VEINNTFYRMPDPKAVLVHGLSPRDGAVFEMSRADF
jgi:uncharacterized protein YecE (DUF72 family)